MARIKRYLVSVVILMTVFYVAILVNKSRPVINMHIRELLFQDRPESPLAYTYNSANNDLPSNGYRCSPNNTAVYSDRPLPIVALFSNPGSGNTWTRHLLERATGIVTGSWFCDPSVRSYFKGECETFTRNLIATKTHLPVTDKAIEKVILLLRDPRRSIYTEYKRAHHVPYVKRYHTKQFFRQQIARWTNCWARIALRVVSGYPGPLLVVRYENLRTDIAKEMRKIVDFLGYRVSKERFDCMMRNSEGPFHRAQIPTANYDDVAKEQEIESLFSAASDAVERALTLRGCVGDVPCTLPASKLVELTSILRRYNTTEPICHLFREYNFACSCPQRIKHACICANGTVFTTKMKRSNLPPNITRVT